MTTPTKKKVLLPNNCFGMSIMLIIILLIMTVPFVVTFWMVGMFAPWWVSVPCGVAASVMLTLKWVTFK